MDRAGDVSLRRDGDVPELLRSGAGLATARRGLVERYNVVPNPDGSSGCPRLAMLTGE